jgi:hypothetical protein
MPEPKLNFEDRDEMMDQLAGIRALHGRDAWRAMSREEEIELFLQAFHGTRPWEARSIALGHAIGVEFTFDDDKD